ncbi:MAG: GGDEF domain-containing protein [Lachnospiraceae bacterium]|nr:GGDEF domain-containing protein [Lachnospiraceae bacterium]
MQNPEKQASEICRELGSLEAMLELFEDIFFIYEPEKGTICLYNTDVSTFDAGVMPYADFKATLFKKAGENHADEIKMLAAHFEKMTYRFITKVGCNIFNDDVTISGVIVKGRVNRREGMPENLVGVIHPARARGLGENSEYKYDQLTGLVSKADITALAENRVDEKHAENTTIAILDVDFFKHVNDTYGHQYGDYVLKQVATIIESCMGDKGVAGRIGGDEFFLVLDGLGEEELRAVFRGIRGTVSSVFEGKGSQNLSAISVSIGSATYPKDAKNFNDLFMVADFCLYRAKEKGRNRYIIYTPEKHPTIDEIRAHREGGETLVNGREDLPVGDALVQMMGLVYYGEKPEVKGLISEFAERFKIPLISLYDEEKEKIIYSGGVQEEETELAEKNLDLVLKPPYEETWMLRKGLIVCNTVPLMPKGFEKESEALHAKGIESFIINSFTAAGGKKMKLLFFSLHENLVWNEQHYIYYRLFADMLGSYTF